MDTKKIMPIVNAFFSFLMALLNNVLKNKIAEGGYTDSIGGIKDAIEGAFE